MNQIKTSRMYYIKKFSNCWAIQDEITSGSRKLTNDEVDKLKIEFPCLQDEKVLTIYIERARSINCSIPTYLE